MKRRAVPTTTIYTGKVGVKMRPKAHRIVREKPRKTTYQMKGGPFTWLLLTQGGDRSTLPFRVGQWQGRYKGGKWEVNQPEERP